MKAVVGYVCIIVGMFLLQIFTVVVLAFLPLALFKVITLPFSCKYIFYGGFIGFILYKTGDKLLESIK